MYGQSTTKFQDWTAAEWASENPTTDRDAMPHWTKDEYVGDRGHGRSTRVIAAEMPEGVRGLSGLSTGSGSEGRGFESLRARHSFHGVARARPRRGVKRLVFPSGFAGDSRCVRCSVRWPG